jgi:general nucleoside transport system permease protein
MTALGAVAGASGNRRYMAAGVFTALGVVDIAVFGRAARAGDAVFTLSLPGNGIQIPSVHVAAAPACFLLGAISVGLGAYRAVAEPSQRVRRWTIGVTVTCFLLALLCWADAASSVGSVNLIDLLQGSVIAAIPLILGALSGLMCERSGVINIAIEGQLITGAFAAAAISSAVASLWLGLVAGAVTGGLVGALLAVFAIKYRVDQIILGVVINVLAIGMTNYLYDRVMSPYGNIWNTGGFFTPIKVPGLSEIPIIGPILFDANLFLYITYALIILIQVGLFQTRWGLRVRAIGEHPTAADTVGIKVLWNRYRNVILGGMIAGIGGAFLTIGNVGFFSTGMSSGFGYIGLAAMIFGGWRPLGAVAAALLFGFARQLEDVLGLLSVPVPSQILAMVPYVATIIAVAGLVGRVRPPAADGKPYIKA